MSMVLVGKTLTAERADALMSEPALIEELLWDDEQDADPGDESALDLDKSWEGVHFLLNGPIGSSCLPLSLAVLGGQPVGPDNGYGPARFLSADEVRAVAVALADVNTDQLRERFDPLEFEGHNVYPTGIWTEDGIIDDYLLPNLERLITFYAAAAASGAAVVLALT